LVAVILVVVASCGGQLKQCVAVRLDGRAERNSERDPLVEPAVDVDVATGDASLRPVDVESDPDVQALIAVAV
jgi:hypothetical protein